MEQKSNGFLKVTGILLIIAGVLGIILSIVALLGVGLAAALALETGVAVDVGLLTFASILSLISAIVSLIAGILGVKNAAKPEKAMTCIIFGCLVVVLSILGQVLNVAGGSTFSVPSLILGLILPVLYLVGAFQNKKKA